MELLKSAASVALEAVPAVLAAIGLLIAWLGLRTWRRQLEGHAEYDLARRVLRTTFHIRDEVAAVRAAHMTGQEKFIAVMETGEGDVKMVQTPLGYGVAMYARIRRLQDHYNDLAVVGIEAEVLWNEEIRDSIANLRSLCSELAKASQQHVEDYRIEAKAEEDKKDRATRRALVKEHALNRRIAISTTPQTGEDEFGMKVQAAVTDIQESMKRYLGKPS